MDASILLKFAGVIIAFVIIQMLWSLVFKAGNAARQAIPEGKGAEIAHRTLMWVLGLGFIIFVLASCVGSLGGSSGDFDEPAYRGRR